MVRMKRDNRINIKMLAGIAAAVVLTAAGVIGGGYLLTGDSRKTFPADGYILEVTSEESTQHAAGLVFSASTVYKKKFPSSYIFKDVQGEKNTVDAASFIHYNDGSLSSFSDGTAVNMQDVGQGFLEFYLLKKGMVMSKASEGWEIDSNRNMIAFPEILWQLTDTKVMAASDEMTLELSGMEPEKVSGYLEVTWVDKGIVQVVSQDEVYQTVAGGGKITYKSGATLDLAEMAVVGAGGDVRFTLTELTADKMGDGIAIRSQSAVAWAPPEFNIYNDDGADGEDGQGGENGEPGESGTQGESGTDGETGESGEDGVQGRQGAVGTAGAVGAMGQSGASIGGGSDDDDDDDAREVKDFGSIRIRNMEYDYESARVTLIREDPDDTLVANTGVIEVREALTNRLVWQNTELDFSNNNVNSMQYDISGLSPDKEYVLLVKSKYSYQGEEGGDPVTGEKIYIKRNFYTNAEGFTMVKTKTDKTGIALKLEEFADSLSYDSTRPLYGMLCIRSGDLWETWPAASGFNADGNPVGLEPVLISDWQKNGIGSLNIAEMMGDRYQGTEKYENRKWTSDIPYTIELYTSTEKAGVWNSLAVTGAASSLLKKSTQVLDGRTLKEIPVIGKVSASTPNSIYYDLTVSVEKDVDSSIKSYRFIITGSDGDKRTLESVSNKARWYYGGDATSLDYTIACEVTYYDNEKNGVIKAEPAKVILSSSGLSYVTYEPDIISGETPNVQKIQGKVILEVTDRKIPSQKLTISVKNISTPSGQPEYSYSRTFTYYLQERLDAGKSISIPIKCLGLENGTVYQVSVWGILEQEDYGFDTQTSQVQPSVCLGVTTVETAKS